MAGGCHEYDKQMAALEAKFETQSCDVDTIVEGKVELISIQRCLRKVVQMAMM